MVSVKVLRWFEEALVRCETPQYRLRANRLSLPVKFCSFAAMFGSHENVDYAERFAIANMVAGGFGAWTANARAFRIEPAP
jgi:hypothetical protein